MGWKRKHRALKQRVDVLEQQLADLAWTQPPPTIHVRLPDMPGLPDYTGPGYWDDGGEGWNRNSYL